MKEEMYFSVDVESDGPVPGLHSMLSIGVTALHPHTLMECGHFYRKLCTLPDARPDPTTMKWWDGFTEQYAEARSNTQPPGTVMLDLELWVTQLTHQYGGGDEETRRTPIFVAYPVSFDFGFYYYYAHRYLGRSPFGFVGLDMASLAMGFNGLPYDGQTKKRWPSTWVRPEDRVAIHNALDDARQQADIFRRMMLSLRDRVVVDNAKDAIITSAFNAEMNLLTTALDELAELAEKGKIDPFWSVP